jgi:hypothetical protein
MDRLEYVQFMESTCLWHDVHFPWLYQHQQQEIKESAIGIHILHLFSSFIC